MPSFCKDRPDQFWEAAELYERKNGRTATSIVLALPKELTPEQRIELTEKIIEQFCNKFNFPYSAAIHNHKGAISGQDQPHLHLMFSERALMSLTEQQNNSLNAITIKTQQMEEREKSQQTLEVMDKT